MGSRRLRSSGTAYHRPLPATPAIPAKAGIQTAAQTTHKTTKTGPQQAGLLR